MKIIISETQYKQIILESEKSKIISDIKSLFSKGNKIYHDFLHMAKLDFKFAATYSNVIGGLGVPLSAYILSQSDSLDGVAANYLACAIVVSFLVNNKKTKDLIEKDISNHGLENEYQKYRKYYKKYLHKSIKFLKILGMTTADITSMVAYSFVIPILPELMKISNMEYPDMGIIVKSLVMYTGLTGLTVILRNFLHKRKH